MAAVRAYVPNCTFDVDSFHSVDFGKRCQADDTCRVDDTINASQGVHDVSSLRNVSDYRPHWFVFNMTCEF